MQREHHIYLEWYLSERAGGPPGYLANLLLGLNKTDYLDNLRILFDTYHGKKPTYSPQIGAIKHAVKKVVCSVPGGRRFYAEFISKHQRNQYSNLKKILSNPDELIPDSRLIDRIDWKKTRTIHVHTAVDVVKIKNYMRKNFITNTKVILTAHTPESYAKEQHDLYVLDGQSSKRAEKLMRLWVDIESRGFREADILIYPSKEAMEPHYNQIDGFADIVKGKDVRFMATGCKALTAKLTKDEAKEKYGVKGKLVVGYIGRHNSVKGYDLLQNAAESVFKQCEDTVFLIGGAAQGTNRKGNSKWIELGWVDPAEMLPAVDVFVLPNRETYYDLVLLEVMSMGIPVIATSTGGNKSVKRCFQELILSDVSAEGIAEKIMEFRPLSQIAKSEIGVKAKECYQNYFTEISMAKRYVDTIHEIYSDYGIPNDTVEESL